MPGPRCVSVEPLLSLRVGKKICATLRVHVLSFKDVRLVCCGSNPCSQICQTLFDCVLLKPIFTILYLRNIRIPSFFHSFVCESFCLGVPSLDRYPRSCCALSALLRYCRPKIRTKNKQRPFTNNTDSWWRHWRPGWQNRTDLSLLVPIRNLPKGHSLMIYQGKSATPTSKRTVAIRKKMALKAISKMDAPSVWIKSFLCKRQLYFSVSFKRYDFYRPDCELFRLQTAMDTSNFHDLKNPRVHAKEAIDGRKGVDTLQMFFFVYVQKPHTFWNKDNNFISTILWCMFTHGSGASGASAASGASGRCCCWATPWPSLGSAPGSEPRWRCRCRWPRGRWKGCRFCQKQIQ